MNATPSSTTHAPIADALVVLLGTRQSLADWAQTGTLARELSLYRELARCYTRTLIVSAGGDRGVPSDALDGLEVVALDTGEANAPDAIERALLSDGKPLASCTIATDDLLAGPLATTLAARLRVRSVRVALVARGNSIPSRFEAHEQGGHAPATRVTAGLESALLRAADAVLATTRAMADDLIWRDALDPARVDVVTTHVLGDASDEPPLREPRDEYRLLFCGPLIARKRVDILVRAVSLLPDELRTRTVLDIVGSGPEQHALRDLSQSLGVRATFHAWLSHDRVIDLMSACDLYLDASAMEIHPRPLIDAMSRAAAVVVSDIPGLRDLVQTGVTGIRSVQSPEAFAQTIEGLLGDADWRGTLGHGAARYVRSNLSLPLVSAQHLEAHRRAHRLAQQSPNPLATLAQIRMLVCDFDGVFTDNRVVTDQEGLESVVCSRGDGMGLEMLRKTGLPIFVLSKEVNPVVAARCRKLKLEHLQGVNDKLPVLQKLATDRGVSAAEIAYVGNDTNDLGPLSWVGLPVVVADVHADVLPALAAQGRRHVLQLTRPGGHGALRELCDLLRSARA